MQCAGIGTRPVGEGIFLISDDPGELVFEFRSPAIDRIDIELPQLNRRGCHLFIPGFGVEEVRGKPLLPMRGMIFDTRGKGFPAWEVLDMEEVVYEDCLLLPPPSRKLRRNVKFGSTDYTTTNYSHDASPPVEEVHHLPEGYMKSKRFYPEQPIRIDWLDESGTTGFRRVRACLYPLRYNPSLQEMRWIRWMRFRITGVELPVELERNGIDGREKGVSPGTAHPGQRTFILEPPTSDFSEGTAGICSHPPADGVEWCRIETECDGIYRITYHDLVDADLHPSSVDPRNLTLTYRDEVIPVYVAGENDGEFERGDWIEFYGQRKRGEHTWFHSESDRKVYRLWIGTKPGQRLVLEDVSPVENDPALFYQPSSCTDTRHYEKDRLFTRLGEIPDMTIDRWFWEILYAPVLQQVSFDLAFPDTLQAPLKDFNIRFQGLTYTPYDPDHHVQFFVNGILVGDLHWDGQNYQIYDSRDEGYSLLGVDLINGENTVSIVQPGDTESRESDIVLLDWFELSYERLIHAFEDRIELIVTHDSPHELYQIRIPGFTGERLVFHKPGLSRLDSFDVRYSEQLSSFVVTFQDSISQGSMEYVGAHEDSLLKPVNIYGITPPEDLSSTANEAELLIISPREFVDLLDQYVDYKESKQISTRLVVLEDIYTHFNYGEVSTQAIKDFILHATQHWTPVSVRYILLVGDGSWDPKGLLKSPPSIFPVPIVYTSHWGATSSDNWYVDFDGNDNLPDIAIGRWPVTDAADLEEVIEKNMQYDTVTESDPWKGRIIMAGGNGMYFRQTSETLIERFVSRDFLPLRLYVIEDSSLDNDPYYGGTQGLIDRIDYGGVVLNFIGHGGGGIWSDKHLFDFDDVGRLHNENKLNTVFSLTCFSGAFGEPGSECLGERFLLEPGKGAVSFWGCTALGYMVNDYILNRYLFANVFGNPDRCIGDILVDTKWDYYRDNQGTIVTDLIETYTLLGDPTQKILFPEGEMKQLQSSPEIVTSGSSISIDGETSGIADGTVWLSIADPLDVEMVNLQGEIAASRFQLSATLPSQLRPGTGTIRGYAVSSGSNRDEILSMAIGFDAPSFGAIQLTPDAPQPGDSVWVSLPVATSEPLQDVLCIWDTNENFYYPDTIAMSDEGEGIYRSMDAISPQQSGTQLFLYVSALDRYDRWWTSSVCAYEYTRGIELSLGNDPHIYLGGTEELHLYVDIVNTGDLAAEDVPVSFFIVTEEDGQRKLRDRYDLVFAGSDTVDVPGNSVVPAKISWNEPPGRHYRIVVEIDPEERIDDVFRGNNSNVYNPFYLSYNHFRITPGEGSGGWLATTDGNVRFRVLPGAVEATGVLRLEVLPSTANPEDQPDITMSRLSTCDDLLMYSFTLTDSTSRFCSDEPIEIEFFFDPSDPANDENRQEIRIFARHTDGNGWRLIGGTVDGAKVTHSLPGTGTYSLMINGDHVPPAIQFGVEGQYFTDGVFVPPSSVVTATVHDANGLHLGEENDGVILMLDGERVSRSLYQVTRHPEDIGSVTIRYPVQFQSGGHEISLDIEDNCGNQGSRGAQFVVSGMFDVTRIGNYPNPVRKGMTVFTFTLTDRADRVRLKIFSPSGRLVREFDSRSDPDIELMDYTVKEWNCTDRYGRPLANGVYFYKIIATRGSKKVEKIMKLAILR
jgi:hypothetical protein